MRNIFLTKSHEQNLWSGLGEYFQFPLIFFIHRWDHGVCFSLKILGSAVVYVAKFDGKKGEAQEQHSCTFKQSTLWIRLCYGKDTPGEKKSLQCLYVPQKEDKKYKKNRNDSWYNWRLQWSWAEGESALSLEINMLFRFLEDCGKELKFLLG